MKIKILEWDDWIKIYIDGKLHIDDHTVSVHEILEILSKIFIFEFEHIRYEGDDE